MKKPCRDFIIVISRQKKNERSLWKLYKAQILFQVGAYEDFEAWKFKKFISDIFSNPFDQYQIG